MAENVERDINIDIDIDVRQDLKTKNCIIGLGLCPSVQDCIIKCQTNYFDHNPERYCDRDPGFPISLCMCGYDC